MEPHLRQPVFATSLANYAPAIQPQAAPWIASPLDIHEDPRIIAFTAEVIAQGITTSTWFAKRIAMATDHRLHAWTTRHEADGSFAGIAPVVIAGAVGREADPGSLWASLTRAGILDTFGTITGWASTPGRRGARMSAITPPARMQVTTPTPVSGPSQRGKRLDLDPDDSMEPRRWQNTTASANTMRRQRTPGGVSEHPEASANLGEVR